jgi:hypothetical protein
MIFVPCIISPSPSPRFSIGPISFIFIDDVDRSEFYLASGQSDILSRDGFDRLLKSMKENHANWLACVPVQGCEQERAQEVAALSVDIAIVALQLAAPAWGTRNMSRLESRRGASEKRTLAEAGGHFNFSWTRTEPGTAIGSGTLADIVQKSAPIIKAVASCVSSFTTGSYNLPHLEQGWCDAAYWLHQGLAEPLGSIAVAKLETALEVLMQGESSSGSQSRMLGVLEAFFGLAAEDPITPWSRLTARQFARNIVRDRSRILHGTWSTLNSRLAHDRESLENFVISVVRIAAIELEAYRLAPSANDDVEDFLKWINVRRTK